MASLNCIPNFSPHLNQDQVMSEFNALQPIFYHSEDDLHSCNSGPSLSEELFDKFRLEVPTPPRSPERDVSGNFDELSDIEELADINFLNTESTFSNTTGGYPLEDFTDDDYFNSSLSSDYPLPDLKDTCSEVFDSYKLIKDCMWNGAGHQPHSRVRRLNRTASQGSGQCNTASGCINPRFVFSSPSTKNDNLRSSVKQTDDSLDGLETPSDSEEEIDVVTVEKKNAPKAGALATTVGVVSHGRKLVGTLVSRQNGGQRHLALVTTGSSRLQSSNTKENDQSRGRINLQLKSVPVGSLPVGAAKVTTKRRWTSPVVSKKSESNNTASVMRLAAPSSLMSISTISTKENTSPNGGKRRIISLAGVSMVSNTGVKQNRSDLKVIKTEVTEISSLQPLQASKSSNSCSEKRKTTKKTSKAKIPTTLTPYETPTNSPGSSNGDLPSPIKRANGDATTSSSGSDEECIRHAHNILERQRREGLRTSFHTLRKCVPELMEQERAPKVSILKKARDHVMQLREEQANLRLEKATEQQRQLVLQQRCRELLSSMQLLNNVTCNPQSKSIKCEYVKNSETLNIYVD